MSWWWRWARRRAGPPHRPPAVLAGSALAGPSGWPAVTFPGFSHPQYPHVAVVGDVAAPALNAGMAGTLAVFEAGYAAGRIGADGARPAGRPRMAAICFADSGDTGSFLYCDFTGPAAGTGPAECVLMPPLPYFRRARQVFAEEWFASMVTGDAGMWCWTPGATRCTAGSGGPCGPGWRRR